MSRQFRRENIRELHFDNMANSFRDLRSSGRVTRWRSELNMCHENGGGGVVSKCGKIEGRNKDVGRIGFGTREPTTGPVYRLVICSGKYNLIRSPIDHRVDVCQPGR